MQSLLKLRLTKYDRLPGVCPYPYTLPSAKFRMEIASITFHTKAFKLKPPCGARKVTLENV